MKGSVAIVVASGFLLAGCLDEGGRVSELQQTNENQKGPFTWTIVVNKTGDARVTAKLIVVDPSNATVLEEEFKWQAPESVTRTVDIPAEGVYEASLEASSHRKPVTNDECAEILEPVCLQSWATYTPAVSGKSTCRSSAHIHFTKDGGGASINGNTTCTSESGP